MSRRVAASALALAPALRISCTVIQTHGTTGRSTPETTVASKGRGTKPISRRQREQQRNEDGEDPAPPEGEGEKRQWQGEAHEAGEQGDQ